LTGQGESFVPRFLSLAVVGLLAWASPARPAEPDAAGVEFFEKRIRPALAEHCYACHSRAAKKLRGGLLLDSRDGLLKGGDSGPAVVPGQAGKSLLVRALRQDQDLRMPPKGKLPEAVIADFVRWVDSGAPDPRRPGAAVAPRRAAFRITEEDRRHWAFQPVADAPPPRVRDDAWCRSALDPFILAPLQWRGLRPSPPADRYALLRRVSFDLAGLPPTPAEVEAFLQDDSPRAFEQVVDRLLASREFGVRWARHWLDGVRYASNVDKGGLYRDWVVRALNDDLPYDRFVRMQLAGDLIPAEDTDPARVHASGASFDGVTATGMLALASWEKVGRDLAVAEVVDSQIDMVGRHLLGLTLACARCHDHKFDPISTADYYALAGIFFSSHISPGKLIVDDRLSDEVIGISLLNRADAEKNRRLDEEVSRLEKQVTALAARAGPAARLWEVRNQRRDLPAQLARSAGMDRKKLEGQLAQLRAEEQKLLEDRARRGWPEDPPELADIARLRGRVAALQRSRVAAPVAIGIQEGGVPGSNRARIGDAPIYVRGDYQKEGPVVPRRFPAILAGEDQVPLARRTAGSGRLELADWIAGADNPLTARVLVNRIWLHLFGDGLVRTPDNFGMLGERPTHPGLLDHLARRFVNSGWSVKRLVREIVLSSTYRQASFAGPELLRADPENRLVGRMSHKRLDYEALRDGLLFVSGRLSLAGAQGPARRTLYEPIERGRTDPARALFDGPDPLAVVPKRAATTTAPQALFLMNNPLVSQAAEHLAERLQQDPALADDRARIGAAYLRLLGRPPSAEEARIGLEYLARGSWVNYLQALLCTNEFVYLD
jgi:hypothetical protein